MFEYDMKPVRTVGEFKQIAATGQPLGLFYVRAQFRYLAMDNRTGTPIVEDDLLDVDDAIEWLADRVEADMGIGKDVPHEG